MTINKEERVGRKLMMMIARPLFSTAAPFIDKNKL
jgi:hypothetical protein